MALFLLPYRTENRCAKLTAHKGVELLQHFAAAHEWHYFIHDDDDDDDVQWFNVHLKAG